MVLLPLLVKLCAATCMSSVAIQWHVFVEQLLEADLHVPLSLIAVKRRFYLAEHYSH